MPFAYADRKCPGWSVRYGRRLCCSHLSQFRGISEPGGMSAAPTCHSFADFLCRVATLLLPPVTVLRHFRARWHVCCSHLPQFRGLPVPGGDFAAPTCHSFVAFLCRVAMSDTTHDAGEIKFCEKIYEKIWREKKSQYLCSPFRK